MTKFKPHRPADIANNLVIGERYTLNTETRGHISLNGEAPPKHIEAKLVGLYPHVAVFEYAFGYTETFDYWTLKRILVE